VTAIEIVVWVLAILATAGTVAVAVIAARRNRPALALVATAPVVIGALMLVFRLAVPAPAHALWVLLALAIAALGVIAGSPLTVLVLRLTGPSERPGIAGGIVVDDEKTDQPHEVLRGGAIIGYLERIAIVVAIVVGHPEAVAVVIAIKGLGRFSELVAPEVRERFIIGTLVSFIWAAACGGVIWLEGGLVP
jgi:hypothetical protein